MLKKQVLIQAIGEAVIPLLGFFFFDWGLYFILLFYIADLIITEFFVNIKAKKIVTTNKGNAKTWRNQAIASTFLVLSIIVLIHVVMRFIDPTIHFQKEFVDFVMYEEAGIPIPQGYILLPLILFGNYQQYKMFFLMTAKHRVLRVKDVFRSRKNALFIALAGIGLAMGLCVLLHLPEIVYLLLIVAGKFFVDWKRS